MKTENTADPDDENSNHFTKRGGTTDLGKSYEEVRIAQILIHLMASEDVVDFKVWSNDAKYGSFDDVIAIVKTKNGESTKAAIQLKHSQGHNRTVTRDALTATNGDFSLIKYFKDYQAAKKLNPKMCEYYLLLQTNKKVIKIWNKEMKLGTDFVLQPEETEDPMSSLLGETSGVKPFKFVIKQTKSTDLEYNREFELFLNKFYFYPQQLNVDKTKKRCGEEFQHKFLSYEVKAFFHFLQEWATCDGRKSKLTKQMIAAAMVDCLLEPFILFRIGKNADKISGELFLKAIEKFHITLIDEAHIDKLHDHFKMKQRDDEQLGHRVLSLRPSENLDSILKALSLWKPTSGIKFIFIMGSASQMPKSIQGDIFRHFNILRRKDEELYNLVGATLKISLEGKEPIPLGNVLDNKQLRTCLTPSHFLQMLDQPLVIGSRRVELPHYISRSLTNLVIKCKYLDRMNSATTVALICSDDDFTEVKTKIPNLRRIMFVDGVLMSDGDDNRPRNIYFCANSDKVSVFKQLCDQNGKLSKNCHCFEYCARDDTLQWLESSTSIENLREYQVKDCPPVPESSLITTDSYPLNIICDEPGMGKSWLLNKLKSSYPTMVVIKIEAKIHTFFDRIIMHPVEYKRYLLNVAFEQPTPLDRHIFEQFYLKKQVVVLWDGLDEVSKTRLVNIFDAVGYFKNIGFRQWIASRPIHRRDLENKFLVLARSITRLNEAEQEHYIKERLQHKDTTSLYGIIKNLMETLDSEYVSELFGIPLQLFMLTEIFHDPHSNILKKLRSRAFSIATLYQYFLDRKFQFYDRHRTGLDLQTGNDQIANQVLNNKKIRQENYEKAGLMACFETEDLRTFGIEVSCEPFLDDIKTTHGDHYGIITSVSESPFKKIANFAHSTYAEFLAARYLTKYFANPNSDSFAHFFHEKFNNIRFFYDAMMAGNSELHLAVLYRDLEKVIHMKKFLDCRDRLGRNPLTLVACWGKYSCYKYYLISRSHHLAYLAVDHIVQAAEPRDQTLEKIFIHLEGIYEIDATNAFLLGAISHGAFIENMYTKPIVNRQVFEAISGAAFVGADPHPFKKIFVSNISQMKEYFSRIDVDQLPHRDRGLRSPRASLCPPEYCTLL